MQISFQRKTQREGLHVNYAKKNDLAFDDRKYLM